MTHIALRIAEIATLNFASRAIPLTTVSHVGVLTASKAEIVHPEGTVRRANTAPNRVVVQWARRVVQPIPHVRVRLVLLGDASASSDSFLFVTEFAVFVCSQSRVRSKYEVIL